MLSILKNFLKTPKAAQVMLLILIGFFFFYPSHNYQNNIATGDHGKDFYCYWATMKGEMPLQDYWWVYGPLIPYYYAAVMKVLGVCVQSILWGEIFLKILAGVCFFLTVSLFTFPLWGFVATLWFWNYYPFFFFTYTHTGGALFLLIATTSLFYYLKNRNPRALFLGLGALFFLSLVKLNIGFAALLAFVVSVAFIDRADRRETKAPGIFYLLALGLVPALVLLTYWFFVHGLPLYALRQSFPYLGSDRQAHTPLHINVRILDSHLAKKYYHGIAGFLFSLLMLVASLRSSRLFFSAKIENRVKKHLLISVGILVIFSLALLHEFAGSGAIYTLNWVTPFSMLFIFFMLAFPLQRSSTVIKALISFALLAIILSQSYTLNIIQMKKTHLYWDNPKVKIYSLNDQKWIDAVNQTADFLNKNLTAEETFFALPYDPIYYYLTDHLSPTRQLMFFYNNHIPPAQEIEIIKALEQKKIKYIVMSNRVQTTEVGLGFFGVTHCKLLAKYIADNFVPVAGFGDWNSTPEWSSNHATLIFERKPAAR